MTVAEIQILNQAPLPLKNKGGPSHGSPFHKKRVVACMTMAKFSKNHGQMVKISTMTTAKIQIFYGQNGRQPKILQQNLTTKLPILTMAMAEKQISYGQNGKPLI